MAKTAGIILIGNEILSGKVVDANASYLCRELRALGVEVRKISVIPDEVALIADEVGVFAADYDVVFTSGGVGPTHDDVTIEGVARALNVPVVRDPRLVKLLEGFYKGRLNDARLKMAEVPDGAELMADGELVFPAVVVRNIYILPGVPEIFRQKFEALRERFREAPFFLCSVFVNMGEGPLAFSSCVSAARPSSIRRKASTPRSRGRSCATVTGSRFISPACPTSTSRRCCTGSWRARSPSSGRRNGRPVSGRRCRRWRSPFSRRASGCCWARCGSDCWRGSWSRRISSSFSSGAWSSPICSSSR